MLFDYLIIGQKIKELRTSQNMSQFMLAEKANISPTYISYIENGQKCMSLETLINIANALNTTPDIILAGAYEQHTTHSNGEFADILGDCTLYKSLIVLETAKAVKSSLRNNKYLQK